jgi:hypothetical protein
MGRKKGFKKKDKFENLDDTFKDAVDGMSTDEIRKRISDIAILDFEYKKLFKEDPEVLKARQALKDVSQDYRDDIKACKLQMEYAKKILDEKDGGAVTARAQANVSGDGDEEDAA